MMEEFEKVGEKSPKQNIFAKYGIIWFTVKVFLVISSLA